MRPFTICYGLMTLTLGSVLVYSVSNAQALHSPFGDARAFAINAIEESQPTILLPPAKPAAASSESNSVAVAPAAPIAAAEPETKPVAALAPRMQSKEVRALLGDPDEVSADGDRWTYGSDVLIFNNDRLAGHVAFDPIQAALNKYNNMIASLSDETPETVSRSAGSGPKVLHAKVKPSKYAGRYRYLRVAAGSARSAYRYDRNHEEYSYYMNRHGPTNRIFSGKRFLPRGMMTTTERNLGQSYLNYGAARYSASPNHQYRR